MDELLNSSAVKLRQMIANREISARELLGCHLSHIQRLNPSVNAIVTLTAEAAEKRATDAEKMLQEDRLLGLLLRRAAEELRPQWEADLREVEERSAAETTHLLRQTEALQEQAALQEAQVRVLAPGAPSRARV